MKLRSTASCVVALAALTLGACGSSGSATTSDDANPAEVNESRVVESWENPGANEIQVLVSNQSLFDTTAKLTIEIDGIPVVDQVFETGDQHNFFAFNVNTVEPGAHTISIRSDDGHEIDVQFDKTDDPLWIVFDYWPETDDSGFTFFIENQPVEFA